MKAATSAIAWRPEEHCLLTVLRGTESVYKWSVTIGEEQPKERGFKIVQWWKYVLHGNMGYHKIQINLKGSRKVLSDPRLNSTNLWMKTKAYL